MARPVIGFLTDFGPDLAPAICRGVMLSIAPDAQIIDIAHGLPKYAIPTAAYVLRAALPFLPVGVTVGVVDPGVGTERRPVAILTARGDVLVGPDNGLLVAAAEELGGIVEARLLENRDLMLPERSDTFHGRDVFAPVAAHLATGIAFATVGPAIEASELVRAPAPQAIARPGEVEATVLYVDSFGNVRLALTPGELEAAVGELSAGELEVTFDGPDDPLREPGRRPDRVAWRRTFGEVELRRPLLYRDSSGQVAFADSQGSAAARLGISVGDRVTIRRA